MKENFDKCWSFVQTWEGGSKVTKDPDDPSGTTKWGISQRAHPDVDVENLSEEDAKAIARKEYWEPLDCDKPAWPDDLVRFDSAFNCGVKTAKMFFIPFAPWENFLLLRIFHYVRIVKKNPTLKKYLLGWLNRCYALYKTASED